MTDEPLAVVCCYLPDSDRVIHQEFRGEGAYQRALTFRDGEVERDDFPGSTWGVIRNEAAREDHSDRIMASLTGASTRVRSNSNPTGGVDGP